MGKKKWTKKEEEVVEKLYKEGRSFTEIAKVLDKTVNAVSNKASQLNLIKKKTIWTDEQVEKLKSMNNNQYTLKDIAEKLNKNPSSVRYKLKRLNLDCKYKKANRFDYENIELIYVGTHKRLKKKVNNYDLNGDYGVGVCTNGYKFYFDLEDYILIKNYSWHQHQDGYLRTLYAYFYDDNGKRHNKYIMMHQLLSNKYFNGQMIDHKNGKAFDNRKENLRPCTHKENMKNTKISISNTSGHKGVHYSTREGKWKAYISLNKRFKHLGTFKSYEDAVKVREKAEKDYFQEWNRRVM